MLLDLIVADGSALVTSADTCEPDPSVWERDIRCLREKWEWKYMKVDRVYEFSSINAGT
jgi:hypothetical protein